MPSTAQQKTEKATPKKLQDARKKGQVPKSADFNAALCLVISIAYIYIAKDSLIGSVVQQMEQYFHNFVEPKNLNPQVLISILSDMIISGFFILLPLFTALVLLAIVSNVAQFGFLFAPKAIKPRISKLNPIQGLKKMFSVRTLFELCKSILKVAIVGTVVYLIASIQYNQMLKLFYGPPIYLISKMMESLFLVLFWGGAAYLIIAVLDLVYQRYDFQKQMRMSKQEVKDELKQTEGDPQIKAWLKRRQRDLLMNVAKKEVPKATVVITNPEHYAVALKYDIDSLDDTDVAAPVVVAKGSDFMAQKIKEIALENGVPVHQDREIARFLYYNVDIGQQIPPELYKAVAEILAAVYREK